MILGIHLDENLIQSYTEHDYDVLDIEIVRILLSEDGDDPDNFEIVEDYHSDNFVCFRSFPKNSNVPNWIVSTWSLNNV